MLISLHQALGNVLCNFKKVYIGKENHRAHYCVMTTNVPLPRNFRVKQYYGKGTHGQTGSAVMIVWLCCCWLLKKNNSWEMSLLWNMLAELVFKQERLATGPDPGNLTPTLFLLLSWQLWVPEQTSSKAESPLYKSTQEGVLYRTRTFGLRTSALWTLTVSSYLGWRSFSSPSIWEPLPGDAGDWT